MHRHPLSPDSGTIALAAPRRHDSTRTVRRLATAFALMVLATTIPVIEASANTPYSGPLSTSIVSGATICEWSRPFDMFNPGTVYQQVRVEGSTVVPTRASVNAGVAQARRTVTIWYRWTNSTQWGVLGEYQQSAKPTTVTSTNWTTASILVPLRPDFRGEIASSEKFELLDAYGRVLQGGTWGPYGENEYWTYRSGYNVSHTWTLGCRF